MSRRRILFHHPRKIGVESNSGSRIRPQKMLKAFKDLGYLVTLVDGTSTERKKKITGVRREIESGAKFDFCYAENAPIPYAITDPDHLPRHPFMDRAFFRFLKKQSIPIGLFYRDIYWRFESFKSLHNPLVSALCLPLFKFDLSYHTLDYIDRLYLPTEALAAHFPKSFRPPPIQALPPGTEIPSDSDAPKTFQKKALYVGGLLPPAYDLSLLFEVFTQLPEWELTIVCRENEYAQTNSLYPWGSLPNLIVLHESGEALNAIYESNRVFLLVREPHPYLDIAIPVKLLEAWGHGLPILTNSRACDASLIEDEGGGWIAPDMPSLIAKLRQLENDPEEWNRCHKAVLEIRQRHTWKTRAETVAQELSQVAASASS